MAKKTNYLFLLFLIIVFLAGIVVILTFNSNIKSNKFESFEDDSTPDAEETSTPSEETPTPSEETPTPSEETPGADATQSGCPDMLFHNGNNLFLYNSKNPVVDGSNPIVFNNLDEYITYHNTQKSNGNNCPLLYLVKENNSQGQDVYRIRPSPFDMQGGLSTSDTYVDSPISFLNITIPPSKDSYSGFDPLNLGVGEYTDLDKIHDSTENQQISDNPMDTNWGGREYTRELVDSGKYDDYNIYRPNLSNSKFGRA